MPNPTVGDVHVNRPLTNLSVAMVQSATNFIAAQVFPVVPVDKKSDSYFTYDHGYWNRDEMQERAPGSESVGNGYTLDSSNTYNARVYAFHKDIPDQIRANSDLPLNLDMEAMRYVTLKALLKREKLFASKFFQGGLWGYDYDGVSAGPGAGQVLQWNDANSNPIKDVWAGKSAVTEKTGLEPNVLVIGYRVLEALVNNPAIVDRVKYGQTVGAPAMIDTSELAQIFKVDRVLVMRAIENTAAEGKTNSHSFIGGKKALLCYAAPAPGVMSPSAGYHFSWTGYMGAGPDGQRIKTFRQEHLASDRVEIEMAFDPKLISADLGAFWDSVVA